MYPKKRQRAQRLIEKICTENFCCSDVESLFIRIRPYVENNPAMMDLLDFVAHNDKRDRGSSFKYIHGVVNSFIKASEKGGNVEIRPIYNKNEVIDNIISTLLNLDFKVDENLFKKQKDKIADCILNVMEETEIVFKNSKNQCILYRSGQTMMFKIELNLTGPVIRFRNLHCLLFA